MIRVLLCSAQPWNCFRFFSWYFFSHFLDFLGVPFCSRKMCEKYGWRQGEGVVNKNQILKFFCESKIEKISEILNYPQAKISKAFSEKFRQFLIAKTFLEIHKWIILHLSPSSVWNISNMERRRNFLGKLFCGTF